MTQVTKTFVGTDGTDITTFDTSLTYTGDIGSGYSLTIQSNKIGPGNDSGGNQAVYINNVAFGLRQSCALTLGGTDATLSYVTAYIRGDGAGWTDHIRFFASSGYQGSVRRNSGTDTAFGTDTFLTLSATDVITIEINAASDTYTTKLNGSHIGGSPYTITAGSQPTGTRIGVGLSSTLTTEASRITQFVADDFVSGSATYQPMQYQRKTLYFI